MDIKGTNITAPVVPFSTDDIYPTHYAEYGVGGYRTVDLLSDLQTIKESRKEEGMLVYVKENGKIYQLQSDDTWKELSTGGEELKYYREDGGYADYDFYSAQINEDENGVAAITISKRNEGYRTTDNSIALITIDENKDGSTIYQDKTSINIQTVGGLNIGSDHTRISSVSETEIKSNSEIKINFENEGQEWSSITVDYDVAIDSQGDILLSTENNSINLTAGPSIDLTAQSVTKNGEEIATESNLKTINGESIVGTGDIEIKGGGTELHYYSENTDKQTANLTAEYVEIVTTANSTISSEGSTQIQGDEVTISSNSALNLYGDIVKVNDDEIITKFKTINNTEISGEGNFSLATQDEIDALDARIDDLQLFKFPNVTIFGEPTITNGQMSDFTANDYAQFPFLVDFHNQAFEIRMCFTTGNQVANQENIFDSIDGLAFAVRNGHFVFAMSSDGKTWNMGEHIGSLNVLPNTTYYIKFSWNKLVYKLEVSTDKDIYIIDKQVTDTRSLFAKQIIIGKSTDNQHIFSGSINLNNCSLSIMGNEVWQGMDDAGLATRLATDLSNIDSAGIQKLNELIDTSQFPSYDYLEEHYTPLTNFNNLQEAHNTFVEATNNKIGSWTSPDYQDDTLCSAIEALDGFLVDLNTNLRVTLYGNENE